jgi:hypothetical protein
LVLMKCEQAQGILKKRERTTSKVRE